YDELLEIQRALAKANPQEFMLDLAMNLNDLGNFYHNRTELGKAEATYNEALEIWRELAETNLQDSLPYLAICLNQLGNLYSYKNEFEKAEAAYNEALEIRRNLAQENFTVYQIALSETVVSLAWFYK